MCHVRLDVPRSGDYCEKGGSPLRMMMKGNEAIGEAAVRAGCRYFFGYPITPQNELPEYLSYRLPEAGGVYLQAESEIAAINMVFGAAGAGARVLTSSSGPGISLKQEGISFLSGAELPCVIVNIMRGGPGLGGIQPGQADYFQATRGGGHGDYRTIVLAPGSVQEMADFTYWAFELADKYRNPVLILGDGVLGQMMEPVVFPPEAKADQTNKLWATTGCRGRQPNIIKSLYLNPEELEEQNKKLQEKFELIMQEVNRAEKYQVEDAEIILIAYGISARVSLAAIDAAREEGIKVGLFRPITLWPFPEKILLESLSKAKKLLVVEMSAGQMIEDVRLAVCGRLPVHFYGRTGGMLPSAKEILSKIKTLGGGASGRSIR
ncbi:MAG: 3-methyl-2-oxobutanoate dehydrogenase subunit VorB [Syntrophomonadaceae bacterium]|nr:3-methyl-2-oxobutanoate dehydrogenase subunit VorB [Syntrophomonadaceae bacterium]